MKLALSAWTLFLTFTFAVSTFLAGDSFFINYFKALLVIVVSLKVCYLWFAGLEACLVLLFNVYIGALLKKLMLPSYELCLGISLILGPI